MRFAIGIPNVREYGDPRLILELGRMTEESGWHGFFIWDHVAYREPDAAVADPWVAISAVAATTHRVTLGVMVCALARRRPWKVAREAASLDLLSDGRARFGAGLGSAPDQEFAAFGEDPDPLVRAARLDEALEIVDRLWSGQPVEYHGEHHLVDGARFLPRPIQRPRIPVWIAGRWPASAPFRRAARWDGVFPTHRDVGHAETMTPEQLTEIVSFTLRYRDSAGSFDVVIEGQTAGEDPAAELERVRAYEKAGLTWWVEKLGWFRGSIDDVRARIAAGPPR